MEIESKQKMETNMKVVEKDWKDYRDKDTVALSLDKEGQYTVSEFIELLQQAKNKFGDKKILIHDTQDGLIGGFSHVYLNHGFDLREIYGDDCYEEDTICIYF